MCVRKCPWNENGIYTYCWRIDEILGKVRIILVASTCMSNFESDG